MKGDGVVLDTNVLISAALSAQSPPAKVTLWVISNARLVFTEPTFEELRSRLWLPKFDRYLSIERRSRILHDFGAIADWADSTGIEPSVRSRDPQDDMFIEAAIAGTAKWLVSGDRDLLEIGAIAEITILNPAQMLQRITS